MAEHSGDISLVEADRFLEMLGLIEGEPTLAVSKTGEKTG